ncbi:MAG TPA: AgmX/PglI C-terminal domain-containing protein [Polyangiaceae bacterium]|nr:AgmX/PglI C-terminal domain-containing protein [Polyangiaceae bacterium]
MSQQPAPVVSLRAAAVWGTTVLATDYLTPGRSLKIGEGEGAVVAKPDSASVSELPIRAVGTGWELDTRGATGGEVYLRGRKEDPADLGRVGAPIPIVAGDYGLIQYGNFGVFFQFSNAVPAMKRKRRLDWGFLFSFLFAGVAVLGGLALLWATQTPETIPKPLELTSQAELMLQFNIKEEEVVPPPQTGKAEDDKGQGVKDPGAKDPKEQGGGKKIKGDEGKLGKNGEAKETRMTGDIKAGLGGMSEALSSEVGDEVRKTLGTISSVADALGGLRSDDIVLGAGSGTGLHGSGSAGGGTEEGGVPFGSGTLDTGWGPGRGGGFGSGSGGPGGRGLGGNGKGGLGGGEGTGNGGDGERKVAGAQKAAAGQGLTPAQISRVVMSRMGAFQACFEMASAHDPTLKGNVGIAFSISPGGDVSSANITGSSLKNPRVEGCMLRTFQRLHFPAADKPTNAAFPFAFRASKK